MQLLFGQITIQVHGIGEQEHCAEKNWKLYSMPSDYMSSDVVLHLTEAPTLSQKTYETGWSKDTVGEEDVVVYSKDRKLFFALLYRQLQKNVTVFVNCGLKGASQLGIQYGILMVLHQRCVGLHGVTMLCGHEIIILSAPSGTGKTTLAGLLEKHCDAVTINGDFALLTPTADGVIFEPTPFCGSSGRCLNHRFRVNRIVFLGQAKENQWRELAGRDVLVRFMTNAFVPEWDCSIQQAVQENVMKCIAMLKVNAFDFAPTRKAAEMFLKKVKEDPSASSMMTQADHSE